MGNKQSILCCSPSCCSTRHNAIRPAPAKIHPGLKEPSEHPRSSGKPKSGNGASVGNGRSPSNISEPENLLNIKGEIAEIQDEINKELQIKDGAEKLRKLIKKRKHFKDVDKFLAKSNAKLEKLNRRLQYLNVYTAEQDALHLPGMCEDSDEKKDVHPGDEATSNHEMSNMDMAIVPLIEPINEKEVLNVDSSVHLPGLCEDSNEQKAVHSGDEAMSKKEISNMDMPIVPLIEPINEMEVLNVDSSVHLPGLCEDSNEQKAVHSGDEAMSKKEISNMDMAIVPLIEPINEMEVLNVDSSVHLPGLCEDSNEQKAVPSGDEAMSKKEISNMDMPIVPLIEPKNEMELLNVDSSVHLPGMCEDSNEQKAVHSGDEAMSKKEISNMDMAIVPLIEPKNEMELLNVDSSVHLPGMCEDSNEQKAVHSGDEAMSKKEISNMDMPIVPLMEPINKMEVLNVDSSVLLPGMCEDSNEEHAVHPGNEELGKQDISNMEKAIVPVHEPINEMEVFNVENVALPEPDNGCIQPKLPMSLEDFHCCSVLGRGGYGKVLLAEHKATRKMYALKAIKKVLIVEANYIPNLMNEKHIFQTLSRGHHPYLVNLFGSFQSLDHTFFAMEYAAGGDLKSQIEKASGSFPFSRAQFYAACVVLGLEYLQKQKIIHRDLKLANIVLDHEGYAKITDFGICKAGIGFGDRTRTFCGTLQYMAPEILRQPSYTRAVDWWSFGVLMYVMLVGKFPFPGTTFTELSEFIPRYHIKYPQSLTVRTRSILRNLLQRNPEKRLGSSKNGAEDVKNDFFFLEINWNDLFSREVKPPFVPTIEGLDDESNSEKRDHLLTPEERSLTAKEQDAFRDFDWIADWMN